ncbi:MAG TPA: hypothetical protein VFV19_09010 [Candidatus Polarisedimenticolaceae bacterium]|nr:hypothetical protein [Candidatus Polarisedimenticolaceae bacterium]
MSTWAAEDTGVSFAFATQAGSGIYNIEGRVVQIYRIPIDFNIRELTEDRVWGATFGVPLTFGFYDYETQDVLEGEFPSQVGTASLLPGVEFPVRVQDPWILYPHADVGAAKDFSGDQLVWVYDTGLRSIQSFPVGGWNARADQEILWAGAAGSGNALSDWYGEGKVGLEFRHDLPWSSGRSRWDFGMFITYSRFIQKKQPEGGGVAVTYGAPAATPGVDEQTEIGFSFGNNPKLAWWKLTMPKLGLSYRFGDGIRGARFVIGEIF